MTYRSEFLYVSASDEMMTRKPNSSSTTTASDSVFVGKASWQQSLPRVVATDTAVFYGTNTSHSSASLQPANKQLRHRAARDTLIMGKRDPFISTPSLDAFVYVKGKTETGIKTETENAFAKANIFFWG